MLHPDPLFEQCVAERVGPDGRRSFQSETFDKMKTFWRHGAVSPPARVQIIPARVVLDTFLNMRRQQRAAQRRFQCGKKQAMIAPRLQARDRARRVSADAVGHEPFALFRGCQVAANFPSEVNL